MTDKSLDLTKKLASLRLAYAEQLPGKIQNIEECWENLDGENKQKIEELHFLTHGIAGSGKIFGFEKLGDCAKEIEDILKGWIKSHCKLNKELKARLKNKIQALHEAADKQFDQLSKTDDQSHKPLTQEPHEEQFIYVIDNNRETASELQSQLKSFGFNTKVFEDMKSFSEDFSLNPPTALVIDLPLMTSPEDDQNTNPTPIARHSDYPIIFTSSQSEFETRLNAVRYGGEGFFIKPVDITRLIDRLNSAIKDYNEEPYRILIVDDDKFLANYYSLILQKHGMVVSITSDPKNVLTALKNSKPELILMDVYMPSCSGIELAKVIRQEDCYLNIPIVFLSTEKNIDKQYLAMRMGGDDFLTKPIENEHLISSVSIRTKRARALNALMDQDSLTGLLKHTKIKERLVTEVSRAKRNRSNLAFAMIDIDNFKQINDKYGHVMGDQVIKSTSQILKQRLRQSDNIGRYGGEEFAVILPDCSPESALQILENIREQFHKITFSAHNIEFNASLSIGIATFPGHDAIDNLLKAADKALYSAKNNGRNNVVINS